MNELLDVKQGTATLINILSTVWLGDWDQYESIMAKMPDELKAQLPFSTHYDREEVDLWHQNHFTIPADHFVSPYFSTYSSQLSGNKEETNKALLCLIGIFEKVGFYYPLERKLYPDHIGSLTIFVAAILQQEISTEKNQNHDERKQLLDIRSEILNQYVRPLQKGIKMAAQGKIQNLFLKEFINFSAEFFEKEVFDL
ncbi:molecular chaperone TorD family protein [Neobacillus sp. SM06]|uniref:molecular chaperone TorD family protein n=1 Tax=Neobacillus sp. SM06 TaxID=3422492 RepID=UPI003D28AA11